jgi:hypothetical protein
MAAQNHNGKIALITGANKGIGYELARQLGKERRLAQIWLENFGVCRQTSLKVCSNVIANGMLSLRIELLSLHSFNAERVSYKKLQESYRTVI